MDDHFSIISTDFQTALSADSTVRILSGFTLRCLPVKIKFKFEIRTLENPPDRKFQILTDRHRTVNPDRIRTALSADVCRGATLNTNLSIRSIWTRRSELNSLRLTIIWNWCGLVNHLSLASLWNLFLVSRFVNLFSWYNINQKIKLNNDSSVILVTPTGEIPWELH